MNFMHTHFCIKKNEINNSCYSTKICKPISKYLYFVFFILILLTSQGCEKSNPVSPTVIQNENIIGVLRISSQETIVNTSDTVLFRFTPSPGTVFTDSVAHLIKTDNNNVEIQEIGILYDNGDSLQGDEIANDNIYNCRKIMNEAFAGEINIKAKSYLSDGTKGYSQNIKYTVYNELASKNIDLILSTHRVAGEKLEIFLNGNLSNIEAATDLLIEYVRNMPGINSVQDCGITNLIINYNSGLTSCLVFTLLDEEGHAITRGGGFPKDTIKNRIKKISLNNQTTGINYFDNSFANSNSKNIKINGNEIGNRKVLIYGPFERFFWSNESYRIITQLTNSTCKGFEIDEFIDQRANVNALNNITDYGFIFISSHGIGGKYFLTGERIDMDNINVALLLSGKFVIATADSIYANGHVLNGTEYYAASYKFIAEQPNSFPNSIILNNSCQSTKNPDLGINFLNKGAKAYYGWSETVGTYICDSVAEIMARNFAVENKNARDSYIRYIDDNVYHAEFEMMTFHDQIKYSQYLENGNFESGDLGGWTYRGDARPLSQLGSVTPFSGTHMGIISTGLGNTENNGSLIQCTKIESNQTKLKFRWNFLSEEFLEYINSKFQDYFEIKISIPGGLEFTKILSIDDIATMFEASKTKAGYLVYVSPEVRFDQGDVYMTGWNQMEIILEPEFIGQVVTISFTVEDVGDNSVDTAVLLDDIVIE